MASTSNLRLRPPPNPRLPPLSDLSPRLLRHYTTAPRLYLGFYIASNRKEEVGDRKVDVVRLREIIGGKRETARTKAFLPSA